MISCNNQSKTFSGQPLPYSTQGLEHSRWNPNFSRISLPYYLTYGAGVLYSLTPRNTVGSVCITDLTWRLLKPLRSFMNHKRVDQCCCF